MGWAHFCALVLQDKKTWGMAFGIKLHAQVSRCLRLRMAMHDLEEEPWCFVSAGQKQGTSPKNFG